MFIDGLFKKYLEKHMNTGWVCPTCKNCYAPFMFECSRCNYDQKNVGDAISEIFKREPINIVDKIK
jgi:hypothetical protein